MFGPGNEISASFSHSRRRYPNGMSEAISATIDIIPKYMENHL